MACSAGASSSRRPCLPSSGSSLLLSTSISAAYGMTPIVVSSARGGREPVELGDVPGRVEPVLEHSAHRPQLPDRPPTPDHAGVHVAAVTGDDVRHPLRMTDGE